jgi:DNA repair exonuclease SbcCD ATPase subunit
MEQLLECLLTGHEQMVAETKAEMKTNQERIKAKIDANQENIDARLEEMKAWRKDTTTCLEKAKANLEKMEAGLEELEAAVDVFEDRLGKMDTTDLEANREKSEAIAVHQEVPNEGAEVETVGPLEDRYGDRRLAVRRSGRLTRSPGRGRLPLKRKERHQEHSPRKSG